MQFINLIKNNFSVHDIPPGVGGGGILWTPDGVAGGGPGHVGVWVYPDGSSVSGGLVGSGAGAIGPGSEFFSFFNFLSSYFIFLDYN